MRKYLLAGAMGLAATTAGLLAEEETLELVIADPGEDRVNATVVADVTLPFSGDGRGWALRVVCQADNERRPGQVEALENRRARVYWVEPNLRAGEERTFQLVFTEGGDANEETFYFEKDDEGKDLFFGDRPIVRHVTVYDPERHRDTHKPYHHVYGFFDDGYMTKGPGGVYDHHKGIYLGWNHTYLGERRWDFWTARNVRQEHREYLPDRKLAGPVLARKASLTDWIDDGDRAVVRDKREVSIWRVSDSEWILDYEIEVEALEGDISLRGDAHHAGFQFRASQEVADRQEETRYTRPESATDKGNEIWGEVGWMALDFPIGDRRYVVTHIDHPDNPSGTTYSTRAYGRFGAFFEREVKKGEPLVLHYRILVQDASVHGGESADYYEKRHADFARPVSASIAD